MGFEIILDNVQGLYSNYQFRKAKYKQEGNIFTVNFYDNDTGEFNADGFSEYIGFVLNVGNYIHIQDKDKQVLISIRETDESKKYEIYDKIQGEFYLLAGEKKNKKKKSKRNKSKRRKFKKGSSKRRSKKK